MGELEEQIFKSRDQNSTGKRTCAGRKKVVPRISCNITKHAWIITNATRAHTQAEKERVTTVSDKKRKCLCTAGFHFQNIFRACQEI